MAAIDAHVDADVGQPADPLERLLLEEAQQLRLQARRHLADLVEEHRAAVGGLEQPALLLPGVGERAALVAEQLALEQLLRQRRAGDVHERLAPRDRCCSGSPWPPGPCRCPSRRSAAPSMPGWPRRARAAPSTAVIAGDCADDRVEAEFAALAACDSARTSRRSRLVSSAFSTVTRHVVEIERLVEVVIRAVLHRLDRVLDGRERGHQDDRRIGRRAP